MLQLISNSGPYMSILAYQHTRGHLRKGRFPLRKITDRIGLFSILYLSAPPDQKQLKILQLFIIRIVDHRFKLKQKNWYRKPMRGFDFVPLRSDPILVIFRSGNQPSLKIFIYRQNVSITHASTLMFGHVLATSAKQFLCDYFPY
jgi:hypothetical protein